MFMHRKDSEPRDRRSTEQVVGGSFDCVGARFERENFARDDKVCGETANSFGFLAETMQAKARANKRRAPDRAGSPCVRRPAIATRAASWWLLLEVGGVLLDKFLFFFRHIFESVNRVGGAS